MFDFFGQVIGYIETVFNYFLNFIESLIMAIAFVGHSGTIVVSMSALMPAILGTCVVITVALAVVKFLIGR